MSKFTSRPRHHLLRVLLPLALFLIGCPSDPPPPPPPVNLTVLGQAFYMAPGSDGALLVQVRDNLDGQPLPDARVRVTLNTPGDETSELFSGASDGDGLASVRFDVPQDIPPGNRILTIEAETDKGVVRHTEEVYVGRVYNVLVSTDKPVYQPGQTIHIRGLALDTLAIRAADQQPLTLTVADAQGNRLMRQELTTSRWGVAAADFVLDAQATSGDYTITAEMGPVTSRRTVEVKPYTLPRFEVNFQTEQPFYLAGETVTGTVEAAYFFGKPVAGGEVHMAGYVTDVAREQIFDVSGQTGVGGVFQYEFALPDHLVGQSEQSPAGARAPVEVEITVVDTAGHAETVSEEVTVAAQPLLVDAVPESGYLRPGVENVVYLNVSYPGGRPAQAELTIHAGDEEPQTVQTDEFGLATIRLTPPAQESQIQEDVTLAVQATDTAGRSAETTLMLDIGAGANAVLLRPEKAEYRIGETLNVDVHVAGQARTVYLDVIKEQQTFGLMALPVEDGVARAAIDLDGSLLGTLELNAYVIADQGEIMRDRRLVLVNPAPAQVEVQADADIYRPGATAHLDITATMPGSQEDEPLSGVLGVSIVDESVFAVGAQAPGFARTYFLLERELLAPRYEIHGFTPLDADDPSPYDHKQSRVRATAALDCGATASVDCAASSALAGLSDGLSDARQAALFGLYGEELARVDANAVAADHRFEPAGRLLALAQGWGPRLFLGLPLLGLAFYDGRRRTRKLLLLLAGASLLGFVAVSCASPAAAPAAEQAMEAPAEAAGAAADEVQQTPRLRQFFPETLLWLPEVETGADGRARIDVPIADSITTWRVNVLASGADGTLGSAQVDLRVFQDFFVEPDLPRFLTVNDEISVPVSIYNYLDEPQEVRLEVAEAGWFEYVEEPQLTYEVGANEVMAAHVPIRVTAFGLHDFQITATGSHMSDAVLRQVEVLPDGAARNEVENGSLSQGETAHDVELPAEAIPGTGRITVKVYSDVASQMVDGLAGLLRMPYGCFEQTSSTTYPNVLVLDYLQSTGQLNPSLQAQAEQYINLGYQRLLTFETHVPGGFSLYGDPPPAAMLTAYGLMEFTDMSRVSYVDPALIDRTAAFLLGQQQNDGAWRPDNTYLDETWREVAGVGADLPVTAYVAWGLADAGYAEEPAVQRALQFVSEEVKPEMDPYFLALAANALVAVDPQAPETAELLVQLLDRAEIDDGGLVHWRTEVPTLMWSQGNAGHIETTALAAIALMRSGQHPEIGQAALDYLGTQRDPYGSFYTTQATVMALKALLLGAEIGERPATITVTLDGGREQTIQVDVAGSGVVHTVHFDDLAPGRHNLDVAVAGERRVKYQVIADYHVPWSALPPEAAEPDAMRVDVAYDRTELAVNDVAGVTAEVELLAEGEAGTVLVDLGVPPGFSPVTEDLDALVASGRVDRYELTGRQILLYLSNVSSGRVYRFDYRLRARFPIRAQTPSSQAYDYYTPSRQDVSLPQRIEVILGTP